MTTLIIIVLILGGIGFWFYRMGKQSVREAAQKDTINTVRVRNDLDDNIKKLSDDELNSRLSKWMRK